MADNLICGIDEVGRGSLAGPIMAVAALFRGPSDFSLPAMPVQGLKDSKAFANANTRSAVFYTLLRSPALVDFGIGCVWEGEIDEIGIEEANAKAFYSALKDLRDEPDQLYVDGNKPVRHFQRGRQIVKPKADSLFWPVSAASILAKTIRDNLMKELHKDYPAYDWKGNAGYGTPKHEEALRKLGPTPYHRKKFIQKILGRS
jgi:ribonuclease HII